MVRLTIHRPDRLPESFSYTDPVEITIGRSRNCTYAIDSDPLVSRLHAVILVDPPAVRVKDLNSTNGISINGERFGATGKKSLLQPTDLHDGDEVVIGQTSIVVSIPNSPEGRAAPAPKRMASVNLQPADADSFMNTSAAETVSALSTVMPPMAGYSLTRILSLASTGTVYLGVDEATGTNVAIKILSPEIPFARKTLEDFRREIDSARTVTHPNLVRLLGAGELERGGMYLVMEYVEGDDLGSYLRALPQGRIPLPAAYDLMLQLSRAACQFHRRDFLHMDIKPASIIIQNEDGKLTPKITDQGFARFLDETGILPRGYSGLDTERLAYLPPEELVPSGDPKPSADVFSLCAVFYRLLTGYAPYDFDDDGDNRAKVEKGETVPAEERLPDLPEPLVVILERGLSLDPDARYQSGCELLDALETVQL